MSEADKFELCGNLCSAARLMGIAIKEETKEGQGSAFSFHDPVGHIIYGEAAIERKDALLSACLALQDYLCVKS